MQVFIQFIHRNFDISRGVCMNKRIRKKFHKLYFYDLVYDVSVSSFWREKIFQSNLYKKHIINKYSNEEIENPYIHILGVILGSRFNCSMKTLARLYLLYYFGG
jgi:hypothetical protein